MVLVGSYHLPKGPSILSNVTEVIREDGDDGTIRFNTMYNLFCDYIMYILYNILRRRMYMTGRDNQMDASDKVGVLFSLV